MDAGSPPRATLDDLYRTEGKAELIGGRIVSYRPLGFLPGRVKGNILFALHRFTTRTGIGEAYGCVGYAVSELPSGRESFCSDASYYDGPLPANPMRFIEGPPTLAVEVRSENDYTPSAAADMAAKRADYFAAGTLVVWDVDPLAETIVSYKATAPDQPVTFKRGDVADAEPAVPGWRIPIDEIFAR